MPLTPSLPTSVRVSSIRGKACRGFWSVSKQANSAKLWLPTKIGSPGSAQSSSSGYSTKREHLSSFSIATSYHTQRNLHKTSWRSSTYSLAGSMEKEGTSLSMKQRMERHAAYKEVTDPTAKATMKAGFDASQTPHHDRARLVRILATSKQHAVIIRWFDDYRKTYNLAMAHVLRSKLHLNIEIKENKLLQDLRDLFLTKSALCKSGRYKRLLHTPKNIRETALRNIVSAIKGYRTLCTKRQKRVEYLLNAKKSTRHVRPLRFNPKFKSRQMVHDSLNIPKNSLKIKVSPLDGIEVFSLFAKSTLGEIRVDYNQVKVPVMKKKKERKTPIRDRSKQLDPGFLARDLKLHYKLGKLYFIFPLPVHVASRVSRMEAKQVADPSSVVALDPGVRKFMTGYSPEGDVSFYGTKGGRVLDRHIRRIRRRKTAMIRVAARGPNRARVLPPGVNPTEWTRKAKKRQRNRVWKTRKRYHAAEVKAKRVVRNFHYNVAHHLLQRHEQIILPTTSSHFWMRGKRLTAAVKRRVQMYSYGAFANRLVQTASFYPSRSVIRCSEAYTSKQCGSCGYINDKLGGDETFKCRRCSTTSDRDAHAARNILLKCLKCTSDCTTKNCTRCNTVVLVRKSQRI